MKIDFSLIESIPGTTNYPKKTVFMTASGTLHDVMRPEDAAILQEDLIAGLRQYRYNAQIPVQLIDHLLSCVLIGRINGADPEMCAYLGCHDLHEAIIGDVIYGVKVAVPEFAERVEIPWERRVHHVMGLRLPDPGSYAARAVKAVDLRCLVAEMKVFGPKEMEQTEIDRAGGPASEAEVRIVTSVSKMKFHAKYRRLMEAICGPGALRRLP